MAQVAISTGMTNKKNKHNLIRSKYFKLVTLTVLLLMVVAFAFPEQKAPKGSLQLSSQVTGVETSIPVAFNGGEYEEQYYNLMLRIKRPLSVRSFLTNRIETLPKNSLISLTVPKSVIGNPEDLSQSHLINIIDRVNETNGPESYGLENEILIAEAQNSWRQNNSRFNETLGAARIKNAISRKGLKLEAIEEVVNEGEIADTGEETSGVCVNCQDPEIVPVPANPIKEAVKDVFGNFFGSGESRVLEEQNPQVVTNIMDASKLGYTASRGKRSVHVRAPPRVAGRSIGACYNGVKRLLLKAGIIKKKEQLPSGPAKLAGNDLKPFGFVNILTDPKYKKYKDAIKSPQDAPRGSILVYEGYGRRLKRDRGYPYGHVEVRTETGFISDFYSETPRTGSTFIGNSRRLIGIYILPKPDNNVAREVVNSQAGES